MSGQSALILGATGAVGRHLLQDLLASPHYTRVGEYGRRLTPAEKLAQGGGQNKLEQKIIDFEKLEESGLKEGKWDVVFITLGTTKKNAGSAEAFERIDREYVVNAAKAAKSSDPTHSQRLIYLSYAGADPKSSFLYPRSKGLTELQLADIGYNDTIVFRSAALGNAERPGDSRPLESFFVTIARALSHVTSSIYMPVETLAQAMRISGEVGSSGLPPAAEAKKAGTEERPFTILENSGILGLANSFKQNTTAN